MNELVAITTKIVLEIIAFSLEMQASNKDMTWQQAFIDLAKAFKEIAKETDK